MGEGRSHNGGPNADRGTVRPRATRAAGGPVVVPIAGSLLRGLGEAVADAEDRLDVVRSDLFADVFDVRVDCPLV